MDKLYLALAEYCKANIEDFDLRADRALTLIDKWRSPLYAVDNSLYSAMVDMVEEYGEENEVDVEDVEIEQILFI